MPEDYARKTVLVDGIETGYLEAGANNDDQLVLIHSGEYGASAEFSWQFNIAALSESYHVIAPDLLGYGRTDKLFDFIDMYDRRVRHISSFLETLAVDNADFIANSMGAGYLASLACEDPPLDWPVDSMILISGGGGTPQGFVDLIKNYDGTREGMQSILDVLFYDPGQLGESFIKAKLRESRKPGHWQSLSAIRFEPPFEQERTFRRSHEYENIEVPTLILGGEDDELIPPENLEDVAARIDGAETTFFADCKHSAHIEHRKQFTETALEFFER